MQGPRVCGCVDQGSERVDDGVHGIALAAIFRATEKLHTRDAVAGSGLALQIASQTECQKDRVTTIGNLIAVLSFCGVMDADDIYSDVDSEGFVEDMRHYGVGQALPLDVRLRSRQLDHSCVVILLSETGTPTTKSADVSFALSAKWHAFRKRCNDDW